MNHFNRSRSTLSNAMRGILLTLPALLGVTLSQAGEPDRSALVVRYDPGSLISEHGRQALRNRIRHAARIVCERNRILDNYNSCVEDATRHALADVEARAVRLASPQTH